MQAEAQRERAQMLSIDSLCTAGPSTMRSMLPESTASRSDSDETTLSAEFSTRTLSFKESGGSD